jgi:hypothetical protein
VLRPAARKLIAALAFLSFLLVTAFAIPARADDAAAKKALDDAGQAYLETKILKAVSILDKAVKECGADKCSAGLRAQLHNALGSIQFLAGDKDKARDEFVEAIKLDPKITADRNYKTPEMDAVFEEAKKKAGGGKQAGGGDNGGDTGQPSGDFVHEAVSEQAVRTPVPVFVTYAGSTPLAKVIVKYKGFGMTEFKPIELTKTGDGWGGLIPCADVAQGTMQYYIQGFDASNDPAANSGDRNKTFKVQIKTKIDGDAPHLPGATAPKACQETGDCPPDFPGCKKPGGAEAATVLKGEDEECDDDAQCKSNVCKHNKCTAPAEDDGEGGDKKPAKFRRVWIGVLGSLDLVFLPSADDVCKLHPKDASDTDRSASPINSAGYFCTNSDGTDYPDRHNSTQNTNLQLGKSDQVKGGIAPGNIRVMASIDYALNPNILLGVRLGYVINTYPGAAATAFAPFHGELRGTYLIGKDALMKTGFAPMVFVGGGASQFDAKVDVTVVEQGVNGTKSVQAWTLGGPAFVAVGGGGRFAVSDRAAITGALKFTGAFGGTAGFLPILAPELGVAFGF